jgi:hypothetical protein
MQVRQSGRFRQRRVTVAVAVAEARAAASAVVAAGEDELAGCLDASSSSTIEPCFDDVAGPPLTKLACRCCSRLLASSPLATMASSRCTSSSSSSVPGVGRLLAFLDIWVVVFFCRKRWGERGQEEDDDVGTRINMHHAQPWSRVPSLFDG